MTKLSLALSATALLAACSGGPSEDGRAGGANDKTKTDATEPAPAKTTDGTPATAGPAGTTEAPASSGSADYDSEKAWAEAHGVKVTEGVTMVVAKRFGKIARSEVYQDTIVVLKADRTVVRYVGTTKPAQMPNPSSSTVPDVDGDGRKDLGIARPGTYLAKGGVTYGMPGYERHAYKVYVLDGSTDYLPAWRDLSGDGVYSDEERATSEQRDYTISGVYIHYGFEPAPKGTTLGSDTYVGPWSVGCQNIPYPNLDQFVADVGGPDADFVYAIVQQ